MLFVLSGCQDMYGYELASIAKSCGGYENIHRVWFDAWSVKANCLDGTFVTAGVDDR
jgi:hypothetical protein